MRYLKHVTTIRVGNKLPSNGWAAFTAVVTTVTPADCLVKRIDTAVPNAIDNALSHYQLIIGLVAATTATGGWGFRLGLWFEDRHHPLHLR